MAAPTGTKAPRSPAKAPAAHPLEKPCTQKYSTQSSPSISHQLIHTMWDRARTSATAGLDRLHRPSLRHLKDGPSTDKPEIYLHEYSPANALGIAVSSFNSRYHHGHQKPQRPPRPERPEILHDKQLFDAASTAGIGMYVHLPSYDWNWLVWPWLRHAECYLHPILSYLVCCVATLFCCVIRPRAHAGSLVKGTALGECASNKETKAKNKLEANRASDYFPITVGWSHDAATTTRRLALSALPAACCSVHLICLK